MIHRVLTIVLLALIFCMPGSVAVAAPPSDPGCGNWLRQQDGSYWQLCIQDGGRERCYRAADDSGANAKEVFCRQNGQSQPQSQSFNLTGNWRGFASQGESKFVYEWAIRHAGETMSGFIALSNLDGSDRTAYSFEGRVQGRSVSFRGIGWTTPKLGTWCIASGELQIVERGTQLELRGSWGPLAVADGCPSGTGGGIYLAKN